MSKLRLMFGTLADNRCWTSIVHLRYMNLLWRLSSLHFNNKVRFEATCPGFFLFFSLLLGPVYRSLVPHHLLDGLQGLDHLLLVEVLGTDRRADVGVVARGGAVVRENLQRPAAVPPQRAGVAA